jgi:nitrate reductase gamma subunit
MNVLISIIAVLALAAVGYFGAGMPNGARLFAVFIPYASLCVFIAGFAWRVIYWASSPVPFRIPTTCGQQKSHEWIARNAVDNPSGLKGVLARMFLEIFFFRSLFRNTRTELHDALSSRTARTSGSGWARWRFTGRSHRLYPAPEFFVDPVPAAVVWIQNIDGMFSIGMPVLYITSVLLLAAISYLFIRRVVAPQARFISQLSDYFYPALIGAIAVTGILMRHVFKVDLLSIKKAATGLAHFSPVVPQGIGGIFYIHLFLVCVLFACFPFSKLMHMPGVFLSPTRNLANNSRMKRHVNPWNYPVKVHTYEEWEDEFREKLKSAGYQLERE